MRRILVAALGAALFATSALGAEHRITEWNPPPEKLSVVPGYGEIPQDLDGAFDFVKDRIRFQIYPGAMRGVRGALVARAGNALDQSLLLAHLLNNRNMSTRVVKSRLGDGEISRAIEVFRNQQGLVEQELSAEVTRLEALIAASPDGQTKASLESLLGERQALTERLRGMLASDRQLLNSFLEQPEEKATENLSNLQQQLREEARDHYWVEVRQPDGTWLALDPTLGLDKDETISSQREAEWSFPDIPEDVFHAVTFTIRAYFQQGNEVRATTPLELRTTSAALTGIPIFLIHPAQGDGFGLGGLGGAMAGLFAKQGGLDQLPLLSIGGEMYRGDPLKIQGWIQPPFFQPAPPITAMAEILTIRITQPNGRVVEAERPIFDLAGSAERHRAPNGPWKKRASLNQNDNNQPPELQRLYAYSIDTGPLSEAYIEAAFPAAPASDTLPAMFAAAGQGEDALIRKSEELEAEYLDRVVLNQYDEVVRELAPNEELVRDASGTVQRDSEGNSQVRKTSASPDGRSFQPNEFTLPQSQSLLRFRLFEEGMRALIDGGRYVGYIAEPNITSFFLGANSAPPPPDEFTAAEITPYLGFDLTHHRLRQTRSGDLVAGGVLAALLEQAYVEILDRTDLDDRDAQLFTIHNVLERAVASNISLQLIRSTDDTAFKALPQDIQTEIASDLSGNFILIPEKPVTFYEVEHFAWFLIDRDTYETSDFSDVFFSQAITEKHITDAQDIIKKKDTACFYRQCLQAALGAATSAMHVVRGNVSLDSAQNLVEVLQDSKACSGKIRLKIKAKQKWNTDAGREKLEHMRNEASRPGGLRTPSKASYQGDRAKAPAQHGDPPYSPASTATEKRDWDHKTELACGGKHEKDNVWALDRGVNRSMGAIIGRACALLCEGTSITEITIEWLTK